MILFGKKKIASEINDSNNDLIKTYVIKQKKEDSASLYPKLYWNLLPQVNAIADCHVSPDKDVSGKQKSTDKGDKKLDHIKNVHVPILKSKKYVCLACSVNYFDSAEGLKEHMLENHCNAQKTK